MKRLLILCLFMTPVLTVSAQNVGIGTTTPMDQLHTTGTVRFEKYKGPGNRIAQLDSLGRIVVPATDPIFSNNTSTNIPDNGCGTGNAATNAIVISGMPNAVNSGKIAVRMNISHAYTNDLRIYLFSPGGAYKLCLSADNGLDGDNYANTTFTDAAATSITAGTAPFAGTFKPQGGNISCFTGATFVNTFGAIGNGSIVPNGTWRLYVFDGATFDAGTLNSWSISFDGTATFETTDKDNYLSKFDKGGLVASTVYQDSATGNLGLGTTLPTAGLDLAASLRIRSGAPAAGKVLTSDSAGNAAWSSASVVQTNTLVLSQNPADPQLLSSGYTTSGRTRVATEVMETVTPPVGDWISAADFLYGTERNDAAVLKADANRFVVFGGENENRAFTDAGIYDPANDSWLAIPEMELTASRKKPVVIWAGTKLVVWGGYNYIDNYNTTYFNTGKIYDPATGIWTPMSTAGAPVGRQSCSYGYNAATNEIAIYGGFGPAYLANGARYNLNTNTWTAMPNTPGARAYATFASGGGKLLVSGGFDSTVQLATSYLYNFATNNWTLLPASGLSARSSGLAEYTGTGFIIWSGNNQRGNALYSYYTDGAIYSIAGNNWTSISAVSGTPDPYRLYNGAYTNGEFFVLSEKATHKYNLASQTWTQMNTHSYWGRVNMAANGNVLFEWGGEFETMRLHLTAAPITHYKSQSQQLYLYKKN